MDEGEAGAGAKIRREDCILRRTGGMPGRTEAGSGGQQPPPAGKKERQQHGRVSLSAASSNLAAL